MPINSSFLALVGRSYNSTASRHNDCCCANLREETHLLESIHWVNMSFLETPSYSPYFNQHQHQPVDSHFVSHYHHHHPQEQQQQHQHHHHHLGQQVELEEALPFPVEDILAAAINVVGDVTFAIDPAEEQVEAEEQRMTVRENEEEEEDEAEEQRLEEEEEEEEEEDEVSVPGIGMGIARKNLHMRSPSPTFTPRSPLTPESSPRSPVEIPSSPPQTPPPPPPPPPPPSPILFSMKPLLPNQPIPLHELQSSTTTAATATASSSMTVFDQNIPTLPDGQEIRMVHVGKMTREKFIILDVRLWTSQYLQQIPAHNIKQALWEAMRLQEERADKASAEGRKRKLPALHPVFRPAKKKAKGRSNSPPSFIL